MHNMHNMHNMQEICNKYAKIMQNLYKIDGSHSLVGIVTELDAVDRQFKPYVPIDYSIYIYLLQKYAKYTQKKIQKICKYSARNLQ